MDCLSSCCVISAEQHGPEHMRWDDHPARVDWELVQDLGAGAFSEVVLARHRHGDRLAALKVVFLDQPGMDGDTRAMLQQEGDILLGLRHPNVVRCSEVVRSPRAHVLVLEFLRGPNVLDGLAQLAGEHYSERDAAGIFTQLAAAVAYLHTRNILHRDIKPENVVFARQIPRRSALQGDKQQEGGAHAPPPPPAVKLVDLGMAFVCGPEKADTGVLGSAGFVAPEVVRGQVHTPAMDVFSMGVLLFIMLVGRKPFNLEDSEKLRYALQPLAAAPGLKDPRWLDLSPDAKHLVMGMLAYDPTRRLSAAQVLQHEWVVSSGGAVERHLGDDVALGAATVAEMRRLRNICGGVVAAQRRAADASVAARGKQGSVTVGGDASHHDAYLQELRRMQKRGASVHGGLRGVARTIAAKSFQQVHDTGGSVHRSVLEGSMRRGHHLNDAVLRSFSQGEGAPEAQAMQRQQEQQQRGGGGGGGMHPTVYGEQGWIGKSLHRSGTALLLSELLGPRATLDGGSRGGSSRGGSATPGLPRPKSSSGLQLLKASVGHYMDVSVRGGCNGKQAGSSRHGGASAVAALGEADLEAAPGKGGVDVAAGDTGSEEELPVKIVRMGRSASAGRDAVDRRFSMESNASARSDSSMGRRVVFLKPLQ